MLLTSTLGVVDIEFYNADSPEWKADMTTIRPVHREVIFCLGNAPDRSQQMRLIMILQLTNISRVHTMKTTSLQENRDSDTTC